MIIVGLGNPDREHQQTRHNVGFMVLDALLELETGASWKTEFGVAWARLGQHWLIKPQEYMNVSGQTLKRFIEKKGIEWKVADLLIVHDELDFPLGEIHEQRDRSAAGHNGVQSIIDAFNTKEFTRLRVGIGDNRLYDMPAEAYVLQRFTPDEQKIITATIKDLAHSLHERLIAA